MCERELLRILYSGQENQTGLEDLEGQEDQVGPESQMRQDGLNGQEGQEGQQGQDTQEDPQGLGKPGSQALENVICEKCNDCEACRECAVCQEGQCCTGSAEGHTCQGCPDCVVNAVHWWDDPMALGAAGIVIALAAVLVGILVGRILGRQQKPEDKHRTGLEEVFDELPEPPAVTVEKLHRQGARKSQQDSFAVAPLEFAAQRGLLAVVADGMGGLSAGDKVSQAAVTAALNGFFAAEGTPREVLLELLSQAKAAVGQVLGPGGLRTGGTTIVMGLLKDGAFHYLSVGDSRICLYRDGALYQLNREHSFSNELAVQAVNGALTIREALGHPRGSSLTSYLGMGELRYVDLPAQPVAVRPGDQFILMCDGVYNALSDQEIAAALEAPDAAAALGSAIQAKGYANQDNYTAVILKC